MRLLIADCFASPATSTAATKHSETRRSCVFDLFAGAGGVVIVADMALRSVNACSRRLFVKLKVLCNHAFDTAAQVIHIAVA